MYICTYVCTYVCAYVLMYVHPCVRMYICMYVWHIVNMYVDEMWLLGSTTRSSSTEVLCQPYVVTAYSLRLQDQKVTRVCIYVCISCIFTIGRCAPCCCTACVCRVMYRSAYIPFTSYAYVHTYVRTYICMPIHVLYRSLYTQFTLYACLHTYTRIYMYSCLR